MKTSALLATLLTALSLSACGGSSSSAVCDEYEKAFADITKGVDAGTKDLMQKSFEQTKAALKDMPADQRDATCKAALDGLKGDAPAASPEDKAEEAKEAAEEAKDAAEEAKDEAAAAKEEAAEAKEEAK
ncbi:hypothetical protein CYK00_10475 [Neisseria sicca]|uniref:Lipoprotein n=1 Tax=Neisseria sicca TaxID=490 RepID=A0A2I1XA03_NEISI|nr:DUF5339 family protein [Neisseria sicca]MBY6283223.1 DUF5339 domain-containing protein [Neisseria flava]PLA39478.1 hypothetical protein CYK00_10475 [Neisseria sicca]